MSNDEQTALYELLCSLTGEQATNALTNYHGLQLLDEGFRKHLQDEGYLEE